jgi:hypothetical protein
MKCPQCESDNVDGKTFCSECGTLLNQQLGPLIRAQVEEYLHEHFRDRSVVEIETSEAVASRVLKWAKLFYAVPVAVLIIILALLGISDYSQFHKTVRRATDELTPKLNQAIGEADKATNKAQDAEAKSEAAINSIHNATAKMSAQLEAAQQLTNRVSGLESKNASQIVSANKHIESLVKELDTKVDDANKTIASQQAKLISTNELVTAMFSKGQVEYFQFTQDETPRSVLFAIPAQPGAPQKGAMIYMLLKSAPIYQTVQLNFRIYVQPKGSYHNVGNVLIFFWADPAANVKEFPLEVSYVPDPSYKGVVYSKLSMKDGHVFADAQQIQ